jgi:hypothetical protein
MGLLCALNSLYSRAAAMVVSFLIDWWQLTQTCRRSLQKSFSLLEGAAKHRYKDAIIYHRRPAPVAQSGWTLSNWSEFWSSCAGCPCRAQTITDVNLGQAHQDRQIESFVIWFNFQFKRCRNLLIWFDFDLIQFSIQKVQKPFDLISFWFDPIYNLIQ